jgi:hypothetical protein
MSCENYTKFNNVTQIGDSYLLSQLEENLKTFLDWGFLNIGGFVNVKIPTSGLYGGTFHELKTSDQPGFTKGQVWQTPKKDWVWETGVVYNNTPPKNISGIKVNNVNYPAPTGSGTTTYYINYPLGQVVFDKPLQANASVSMEYSYRWCQVYKSSIDPYWTELQQATYEPSPAINQRDKGDYQLSSNHRIQMPCIVIEPIASSSSKGWQMGGTDFIVTQDILLHVFAENGQDQHKITDILRLQKEKTIWLYDINKVVNSGVNPLNYRGSLNNSGKVYCDLATNPMYQWHRCFFKDIVITDMESRNKNLYWCTIRLTTEVII